MFDKLKQISQLREMQEQMKKEKIEVVEKETRVVLNGNFEVEEVVLNPELDSTEQAEILKSCFNRAVKGVQLKIARNFSHLV